MFAFIFLQNNQFILADFGLTAFLIKLAIMVTLAYVLRPRPKTIKGAPPRAAGIEEFNIPTAEEGRPIQVLFGKRRMKGPNVVWYGDLKSEAIWR